MCNHFYCFLYFMHPSSLLSIFSKWKSDDCSSFHWEKESKKNFPRFLPGISPPLANSVDTAKHSTSLTQKHNSDHLLAGSLHSSHSLRGSSYEACRLCHCLFLLFTGNSQEDSIAIFTYYTLFWILSLRLCLLRPQNTVFAGLINCLPVAKSGHQILVFFQLISNIPTQDFMPCGKQVLPHLPLQAHSSVVLITKALYYFLRLKKVFQS